MYHLCVVDKSMKRFRYSPIEFSEPMTSKKRKPHQEQAIDLLERNQQIIEAMKNLIERVTEGPVSGASGKRLDSMAEDYCLDPRNRINEKI